MTKSKYCYVIANEENGSMLLEDCKLPIYWNKRIAKERQSVFGDKWIVLKIELEIIEKIIFGSVPA